MTSPDQEPKPERIAPARFGAPVESHEQAQPAAQSAVQKPLFWAAVLSIALLLILVVLWLPSQINERQLPSSRQQGEQGRDLSAAGDLSAPAPGASQADAGVPDTEAVLAKRQLAQRIADALQLRRAELEKLAVERWAASDYKQIQLNDERARHYFEQREFEAAATYWQKAIADANTLLGQVEPLLKATLVEGHEAIEAGDSDAAIEAFELALAIHPENTLAALGMSRARALQQVLTLLAAAENHEREDRLDQALMMYRQALSLDPQAKGAKEGMLRAAQGMQDWEFRIALSTAQQALEAGDYAAAKREFLNADKIKGGQAAVKEGLAQAEFGLQQEVVERLRVSAERAERSEAWAQAERDYQRALKLDASLSFAAQGLKRAQQRLALDQSLRNLIEQPQRLYSDAVRQEASALIDQARSIESAGPRLRQQTETLRQALAKASRKLTVTLVSDNSTHVMVYRVGKLGQFQQTRLELTPGDYVIVGRREGYRDTRKTLSIRPDMDSIEPFDIRCTEKI
ncbi:MAG: hypothetical protein CMN85_18650 [Spongiibacteraceae bacterium]|nr:hypothetical protein [Spongiibacteraceae bacterium]